MLYIYFFPLDLIVFLCYTYIRKVKDNTSNQKGLKMAAHIAFDTEATSLVKPFCYDIGYVIFDDDGLVLDRKHFVVEQNWHNLPLFESAYYKEKRPLYVQGMRRHEIVMDKYGYIMQTMRRDIKKYNVVDAYAYNSPFDEKVFDFNCDWFKCNNPLEDVPVYDIMGYAVKFLADTPEYKVFCELHNLFTETGNYSMTAENLYRFITMDETFEEAHTGLKDAEIETEILFAALRRGAHFGETYTVPKSLSRIIKRPYTIKVNGKVIYHGEYIKKYHQGDTWNFTEGE